MIDEIDLPAKYRAEKAENARLRKRMHKLENDIEKLKVENEQICQNNVRIEVYRQMVAELDAAVLELAADCRLQYGGCNLCANNHTDTCKSCIRDDIWADVAKEPKDRWQWRGPQKEEPNK